MTGTLANRVPAGTRIGRYTVSRPLDSGGMGVVLVARDSALRRDVVIKLVRPDRVDSSDTTGARDRLRREAQAMAKLSHRNVVPVYDVGTHEGELFIAMEYVVGSSLAEWLSARERSVADVLDAFVSAGRGLAAAHDAGLVHRDFKPENVMVSRAGEVKVTDFGIARAGQTPAGGPAEPSPSHSLDLVASPMTVTGALVGTPGYMAPEQILGQAIDHRCDQFSFCVALHEALYGQRPFAGDSLDATLQAALDGNIRTPAKSVRVPRRVRDAILRGLSASPDARFPSIAALLAELQPSRLGKGLKVSAAIAIATAAVALPMALLSRGGAPAAPACGGEDLELATIWGPQHKADIAARLAASGIQAADQAEHEIVSALDDYASQWNQMHGDNCEDTRVRHEQTESVMAERTACLSRRRVELRLAVEQARAIDSRDAFEVARNRIKGLRGVVSCNGAGTSTEDLLPADPAIMDRVIKLRLELADAQVSVQKGSISVSVARIRSVLDRAREIPFGPLEADALLALGRYQMLQSQWEQAAATMTEAVDVADVARHGNAKGEAQLALIAILRRLGRLEEAERYRRYARATLTEAGSLERAENRLAESLVEQFLHEGKVEEAIEQRRRILERCETAFGKDSMELAQAAMDMGSLLTGPPDRNAEAIPYFERARDIFTRREDPTERLHARIAQTQIQNALYWDGRFAESIAAGKKVLASGKAALFEPGVRGMFALAYLEQGDKQRGLKEIERVLELGAAARKDSLDYAFAATLAGNFHYRAQDYPAAEALLREALAIQEATQGRDHDDVVGVRNAVATLMMRQGRAAEAVAIFTDHVELLDKQLDPKISLLATTLYGLGGAHLAAGDADKALPVGERALEILRRNPGSAHDAALAKWVVARAVWETGGDKARALQLAREAHSALAETIERQRTAEIAEWLAAHQR